MGGLQITKGMPLKKIVGVGDPSPLFSFSFPVFFFYHTLIIGEQLCSKKLSLPQCATLSQAQEPTTTD